MTTYDRVIKECFWDMHIEEKDINAILNSNDLRKKTFLFDKILLNSTRMLSDLKIFTRDDLKMMIENFKVPKFNADYIGRRKNMAEVFYLDKPLEIDELKWIA